MKLGSVPRKPAIEAMLMMRPRCAGIIACCAVACVNANTAFKLRLMTLCHASSGCVSALAPQVVPALFTRMSMHEQRKGAGGAAGRVDRRAHHLRDRGSSRAAARRNVEIDIGHWIAAARGELHRPGALAGVDRIERDGEAPFQLFLQVGTLEARD